MNNKVRFVFILSVVVVLVGSMFFEQLWSMAYSVPYKFNHWAYQIPTSVDKEFDQRFDEAMPRGGFSGSSWNFSYASFYDAGENKYYYRFSNISDSGCHVQSRFFAILTGSATMDFAPTESRYFVVENHSGTKLSQFEVDAYQGSFWFPNNHFGTSISLNVPD